MSGRAARAAKRRKFKTLTQLLKELYVGASTQSARLFMDWEAFMVQEGRKEASDA